ncbi:MAG: NAD(P)H-hydrate dehydratase [Deltaproteobacteria bacterium]|nr:NAD(P)H-hydrate dehydratase [Deltaproteobacteria bacterium]
MKLAIADTIREIDRAAVEDYGMTGAQLMENAGRGVACAVLAELASTGAKGRVAVIAGKGNNGGDGYVAARHLRNAGLDVMVFSLARPSELKGDAALNAKVWARMGGATAGIITKADIRRHAPAIRHACIIVDAIFGVGLKTPVKGVHAEAIEFINSIGKKIVAVDVPSGIDAGSGAVMGAAIKASLTVTMAMPKPGLYLYPGREYAGRVEVVDIGVPVALLAAAGDTSGYSLITPDDVAVVLRPRNADSHKGSYGHLFVLAGSPGKTGAAYMCATGGMRAGAGLTTIGLPESLEPVMEAKTTEVMTTGLPETAGHLLGSVSFEAVCAVLKGKAAVVIGPGIGLDVDTTGFLKRLLKVLKSPVVIDADGLGAFVGCVKTLREVKAPLVLTPHPGEMARLLDMKTTEVQADRPGAARRLCAMTGAVVVLKGAATIVAAPDGGIFINPTGNAGLATAGTGDVLAGMIGGLLSQGYGPVEAACAAVYIHGAAADEVKAASGETGMMATDLLPVIPGVMRSLCRTPGA